MTIKEMIEAYDIKLAADEKLRINNPHHVTADNALEMIKSRKPEIIAFLHMKKAAADEAAAQRRAKIEAIEGLSELHEALRKKAEFYQNLNRMMDDENNDGVFPPRKPEVSPEEIAKKYPRAAAYVRAEDWSNAAHCAKASIGEKALDAIINGADYESAVKAMETEWSEYCTEHIWD